MIDEVGILGEFYYDGQKRERRNKEVPLAISELTNFRFGRFSPNSLYLLGECWDLGLVVPASVG